MNSLILAVFLNVTFFSSQLMAEAPSMDGATCRFNLKDYQSPGYGLPKRNGVYIEGRFGCQFICTCPSGKKWIVSHVYENKYLDLNVWSKDTGGVTRAKWFICPKSVKEDTWKPIRDELGRPIAYSVEPNFETFPAHEMRSSPQIQSWFQNSCSP